MCATMTSFADEIEDESLEGYAERRHIKLTNPKGPRAMPVQTRHELIERIRELEEENEELRSRLEEIGDLASTDQEEEEEDDQGEE